MSHQQDIRNKVYDALELLVQTRPLSEVKVIDVCKISGVPRSTFYTYFCDIYSVPQFIWDDMMESTLYKIGDTKTWDEGHRLMFQNLLKKKLYLQKSIGKVITIPYWSMVIGVVITQSKGMLKSEKIMYGQKMSLWIWITQ